MGRLLGCEGERGHVAVGRARSNAEAYSYAPPASAPFERGTGVIYAHNMLGGVEQEVSWEREPAGRMAKVAGGDRPPKTACVA